MTDTQKRTAISDPDQVFAALDRWIRQRPGLDWRDYGTGADGRRAYRQEVRDIGKDKARAMAALQEARGLMPARPDLLADSFRAYSGRLELRKVTDNTMPEGRRDRGYHLSYVTGQYWPTEYRKAAAAVLETYCAAWKQAHAAANPRTFTFSTVADVRAANQATGQHWFDRSSMRFFNTRIESRLIGGKRFITSEQHRDTDPRLYTIREAQPDGSIDTVGEFQEYRTLADAKAHVLRQWPENKAEVA